MASIWDAGSAQNIGVVAGDNTYKSQYFEATEGQKDFILTAFAYTVGEESVQVLINGGGQILGKDYTEPNGNTISLVTPAREKDIIQIRALIGSESSQAAATSAANAKASEDQAKIYKDAVLAAANIFIATSASNITVGTGAKAFNVGAGKQFQNGQWVMSSVSNNSNIYMVGQVTNYVAGVLTLNVTKLEGAGTYANWNVSLTGVPQPVPPAASLATNDDLAAEVWAATLSF